MSITEIVIFVGIAFVVGLAVTLVVAFVTGVRDAHKVRSMWNNDSAGDKDRP